MKPIIDKVKNPCVRCGKEFAHEVYFRIDGHGYPDLKMKVLNYTAFASQCPHCMGMSSVPQDFRYFDEMSGTQYMIYYFPKGQEAKLEDVIAATLCLRDSGIRVHITHSLVSITSIILDYDDGNPPEERLFKVSDAAMIRAKAQSMQAAHSFNKVIEAMKINRETGTYPDGFIESLVEARQTMQEKSKKSIFKRLFRW